MSGSDGGNSNGGGGDGKLRKLKTQLSIKNLKKKLSRSSTVPCGGAAACDGSGGIEDEEDNYHLLEDVEGNNVESSNNKSASCGSIPKGAGAASAGAVAAGGSRSPPSKYQIPSSLVTLTESEKRQLQEVLLRIGLREVGL